MRNPTTSEQRGLAPVSLDELTAQALAADPDAPVDDDATPFASDSEREGLLPSWYMPAPARYPRRPGHRVAAIVVIASFLAINALGLCITYGHLTPA